jgi:flagellar basal-body rod protein FlgC
MNNKRTGKFVIIVFAILFLVLSCNNKNKYIMTFDQNNKELLKNYILFRDYPCKLNEEANYITLDKINKEMLIGIIQMLYLKIDIIKDNIANVNTTRTANGDSYTRKYLSITIENGIEIIEDTNIEKRIIWDPTHPDAILTGKLTGYVEMPNVDIFIEYCDLYHTIQLYNSIVDFIKNNYKNIMIEKINILSQEEIVHNLKIERILELQLKENLNKYFK